MIGKYLVVSKYMSQLLNILDTSIMTNLILRSLFCLLNVLILTNKTWQTRPDEQDLTIKIWWTRPDKQDRPDEQDLTNKTWRTRPDEQDLTCYCYCEFHNFWPSWVSIFVSNLIIMNRPDEQDLMNKTWRTKPDEQELTNKTWWTRPDEQERLL